MTRHCCVSVIAAWRIYLQQTKHADLNSNNHYDCRVESVAGDVIKICNGLKELNECIERNVECWQLKHQTQCNCLQYLKATC